MDLQALQVCPAQQPSFTDGCVRTVIPQVEGVAPQPHQCNPAGLLADQTQISDDWDAVVRAGCKQGRDMFPERHQIHESVGACVGLCKQHTQGSETRPKGAHVESFRRMMWTQVHQRMINKVVASDQASPAVMVGLGVLWNGWLRWVLLFVQMGQAGGLYCV